MTTVDTVSRALSRPESRASEVMICGPPSSRSSGRTVHVSAGAGGPSSCDIPDVHARARAARHRAGILRDLVVQAEVETMIARVRVERVEVSPVVEARLQLRLGRLPSAP